MPCRKLRRRLPPLYEARRAAAFLLAAPLALALAACGGRHGNFDTPEPAGAKLAALLGKKADDPAPPLEQSRHIFCPEIIVLEGTAANRVYAGAPPSAANLRYQSTISDTARECAMEGSSLSLKVGVAGKVLLGPAGSAGNFSVPVRIAVLRKNDNQPLISKLYRGTATVASGATQADYTVVSEPLQVPFIQDHTEDNYTVRVGIDDGASQDKTQNNGAKQ